MKLPELKKRFQNKYVVRIIAGVLTIAMVGTGFSVYTVHAEKAGTEAAQTTDSTSDSEDELSLSSMLKDNVSVSEKEIDKDETVYLISDASGNVNQTIVSDHLINRDKSDTLKDKSSLKDIENVKGDETFSQSGDDLTWQADGNDIYYQGTSTAQAPVSQKVTYYLDGKEISPEDLAGKSGKVTIHFDYTNHSTYTETVNGEEVTVCVPFAAITGMVLDDSFSNVEVTNGKVQNTGKGNIVIGYALPGLKDSLDLNDDDLDEDVDIPESFEVTADVENFSLETAMTVVANAGSFLSTDGSSDLSSVDDMIDTLTDASEQLQDGSKQLSDGLDTLQSSLKEFSSGMNTLSGGIKSYTDGAKTLGNGINTLNEKLSALTEGRLTLTQGVNTLNSSAATIRDGIGTLDSALNTQLTDAEKASYAAQAASQAAASVEGQKDSIGAQAAALAQQSIKAQSNAISKQAADTATKEIESQLDAIGTQASDAVDAQEISSKVAEEYKKQLTGDQTTKEVTEGLSANSDAQKMIGYLAKGMQSDCEDGIKLKVKEALIGAGYSEDAITPELIENTYQAQNRKTIAQAASEMAQEMAQQSVVTVASKAAVTAASKAASEAAKATALQVAGQVASQTAEATASQVAGQVASETAKSTASQSAQSAASQALITGIEQTKQNIAAQIEEKQAGGYSLVTGAQALAAGTNELASSVNGSLSSGIDQLADGVGQLAAGANTLVSNNDTLNSGAAQLVNGTGQIVDGVNKLDTGSHTLADGMVEFNEQGINKIVNAYKGDLKPLANRLQAMIDAGEDYQSYSDIADGANGSVKFIYKLDSIKEDQ
ncbi:hypothetical protein FYJ75_12070 [Roseburia sp. MUC/MUC-530-WT-4D]|uniref:X-X-X-Leu-X-X-Gly heptad repeats n=1 Tax=Roseburia porci TaxID=2605790 RepID=A0A6L5YUB2_9FIRM|nr:hypothetical protein [Roseburia porci]MST75737.1 hypothetical protein [Roseburia porci]